MNNIPSSLVWACRRGMLELDILLGNFLKRAYPTLSIDEQKLFSKLLTENDQNLYYWLTGKELPDSIYHSIIQKIRHHAEHGHSS